VAFVNPTPQKVETENDFDPFATDYLDDDLERADQRLKKAEEELQKSIADKNATRQGIIENAKKILKAGGNPADVNGWEKISKMFNITPDDLD
jgi:hypothetical protein